MPAGHVTLVESIARIYLSAATETIWMVGSMRVETELRQVLGERPNVQYLTRQADESVSAVLQRFSQCQPDETYLVTSDAFLEELAGHPWQGNVHWVIHNLDAWFNIGFWNNMYAFLLRVFNLRQTGLRSLGYWWKWYFVQPAYKRKILRFLQAGSHKFVVLNALLKAEILPYVQEEKIEVIPFSLYAGDIFDLSGENSKLRVCVPGYVTQIRRDYIGLLKLLEQHADRYAPAIEFDFLGGPDLVDTRTEEIIARVNQLQTRGLTIYTYRQAVKIKDFDQNLALADVILGNLNIQLNRLSRYGKTKESGVPFTMIKAAKPGLLPTGYATMPELSSSTLFYQNYTELDTLFTQLSADHDFLRNLKANARRNAQAFTPENVYHHLHST